MKFANIVSECSDTFNTINKDFNSNITNLKSYWEGPASNKFFITANDIKGDLEILKTHFSLYEAAGNQIKVLEEVIENLELKEKQYSNATSPSQSLMSEITELKKQKKILIGEINEYFNTIKTLDAQSLGIDIKLTFAESIIYRANKVNSKVKTNITDKPTNETIDKTKTSTNNYNSNYANKVGTTVANTSSYHNDAAPGQCVWYVRGRAVEKFGKDTGAIGNGNEMALNCKESAKLEATKENIKDDIIVSYRYGTSSAGQRYGHVIYVEAVDGETVYYTECKSGGKPAGTVKQTTKDDLLNGTTGCGTGVIGFIDVAEL